MARSHGHSKRERGVLPEGFWNEDESGITCAVDMAFMSTSRDRHVPVGYLDLDQNVLWHLEPSLESDAGYHYGADISLLSQFGKEKEVLFPPCTMLEIDFDPITEGIQKRSEMGIKKGEMKTALAKWVREERTVNANGEEVIHRFLELHARPRFL